MENFITEDQAIINSLIKDFIYGELFDVNLFIKKDFSEFLKKMKEIREKNKIYFQNLGRKSKPSDSFGQNKKDIESEEDDDNTI